MKRKYLLILLLLSMGLTACSGMELEERSFPMLVAVGEDNGKIFYKEAFPKEDDKGVYGAKELDYSHLKVLVLEEDFLENSQMYKYELEKWAETEMYPRNTYVCVVDDISYLFELEKKLSQDLGSYLEEYLKKYGENINQLLTLGDLIDTKDNEEMVQYIPYMEVEENQVKWLGYVNISGKRWQESIID